MRIRIALATALSVCIMSTVIAGALGDLSSAQAAVATPPSHGTAAAPGTIRSRLATHVSKTSRSRSAETHRFGAVSFAPFGLEEATLSRVLLAAAPPAPAPAPAPAVVAPAPPMTDASSTDTADWACIRVHESGDRYNSENAPSGAYGIVQMTWHSFGYSGWPYEAAASTQDALALHLYHLYGWAPWSTRYVCGL